MDEKLSPAIDHYLHGRLKLLYLLAYLLEPFIWCSTYVHEQASDDKANERNGSNGKGNAHSI